LSSSNYYYYKKLPTSLKSPLGTGFLLKREGVKMNQFFWLLKVPLFEERDLG